MPKKSIAEEIIRQTGRRRQTTGLHLPAPYEPCARDLEWYLQWTRDCQTVSRIAASCEPPVTWNMVKKALKKVEAWLRLQLFETVISLRTRHTHSLEHRIEEMLELWKDKKGLEYLVQAREMMAEIRQMWGVDAPARLEIESHSISLVRVDGMSRVEAIEATGRALLATAESIKINVVEAQSANAEPDPPQVEADDSRTES